MRQGRSYTPLSHIQVCPHQPVLSLIMQPQTCTSHTVTQLMRRSSLPRNSCEFSKSIRKSYLFCTFIWDRTSWSKLRNTPAALIGSFRSWKTRKWEREWEALFFMRWGKDFYNRRILEVTLDHKIWGHGTVPHHGCRCFCHLPCPPPVPHSPSLSPSESISWAHFWDSTPTLFPKAIFQNQISLRGEEAGL